MRHIYQSRCQFLLALSLFLIFVQAAQADGLVAGVFDFESGLGQAPDQWGGGPVATLSADSVVVHTGKLSGRIERLDDSEGQFSALRFSLPSDREGEFIELRGWLKSEDVENYFGMWFRQDSKGGIVGFDNMQQHKLKGTTDWTEYRITLPLATAAHNLIVGSLMSGTGTLWADDFSLWIDGRPFDEAPIIVREPTVLDTDTEFDTGSGIEISELSETQIDNLYLLGRVWGFFKYHHPAVTAGKQQWDFELFRVLPRILAAADRDEALTEMISWIDALGQIEPCDPCAEAAIDPAQGSNTDWLSDTALLGEELSARLMAVHTNRPATGEQFWVDKYPGIGNPDFSRELSYDKLGDVDAGFRLLALYRFWNIIEYWCPNRDIIGESWPGVLREFVPQVALASDLEQYKLVMLMVVARLNDTHTQLYGAYDKRPPGMVAMVPVDVRWVENRPVVSGWANEPEGPDTKLQIGDIILAVDGRSADELMDEWAPYYSASNEPQRRKNLAAALVQGPLGLCELRVLRGGEEIELSVERMDYRKINHKRHRWHTLQGEAYRILPSGVAYMALETIKRDSVTTWIEHAIKHDVKGLILDCRSYPSDFPIFQLGNHLVAEPTPFVTFTIADKSNPGTFTWLDYLKLTPAKPHFDRPLVILVDEISMSSAEYHALAFRAAPQAIVMGSTTSGADGNISRFSLPGNLNTVISGIGIFDANHGPTQRVGIIPDVVVKPTIAGIRAGQDEVLEAAVESILKRTQDE